MRVKIAIIKWIVFKVKHEFFHAGLKLFKDGLLQASTTHKRSSVHLRINTGEVNLGRYLYDQNLNYGIFTMDEILIWNSALSDAEVGNIPY